MVIAMDFGFPHHLLVEFLRKTLQEPVNAWKMLGYSWGAFTLRLIGGNISERKGSLLHSSENGPSVNAEYRP